MGPHAAHHRKKEGAYCVSFENFAYGNLGYTQAEELGPGEIVRITTKGVEQLVKPRDRMKICTFLWVYYGYPTSSYEGVNVEEMRYHCGEKLADRDNISCDLVAGVPDSGTAHAIGYANRSGIPFARPFIKYTPHLASLVHAAASGAARSHRPHEADPGSGPDPRQEPAPHR